MTLNLEKNTRIFLTYMRMHTLKLFEYRINYIFDTIIRFLEFAVFFFFWQTILGKNLSLPGWDLTGLLVLYAFQQVYLAFFLTFALGAWDVERSIFKGDIDKFLCRPCTPWFMLAGETMSVSIGGWITGLGALFIAHFVLGAPIFTIVFPILLLMTALGAAISLFFGMALATFGFWGRRLRLFGVLLDGLFEFDSYPMTVFPATLHILTSFTLPFLFADTLPAMSVMGMIPLSTLIYYLAIEIGILIVNFSIFKLIWERGVRHYESYGG
jgi:ABC-type uncharacterized transport system permease subunit